MRRRTIQSHLYLLKILGAIALLAMSSHAIIGLGVHYAPNLGSKLSGSSEQVFSSTSPNVTVDLSEEEASPLTGIGIKLWIDALPFVDLIGTFNVQGVLYDAQLEFSSPAGDTVVPMSIDPGIPGFGDADPAFGMMSGDLSVVYPFLKLPPVVNIIQFHAGAGLSMVYSKKIITRSVVESALESQEAGLTSGDIDYDVVMDAVVKDLTDRGSFDQGVGGHLIVGARAKLPVIPIGIYLDGKYLLGGSLPSSVSSGLTLEMGAGLAF